jgi:hypothetical protein
MRIDIYFESMSMKDLRGKSVIYKTIDLPFPLREGDYFYLQDLVTEDDYAPGFYDEDDAISIVGTVSFWWSEEGTYQMAILHTDIHPDYKEDDILREVEINSPLKS